MFAVIVAAVPPIVTPLAAVKLVPVITKDEPTQPLAAPKLVMIGGGGGVQVNVLPLFGYALLLVLHAELFDTPAVVAESQTTLLVKLLLLKSALLAPLNPTSTE